MPETTTQISDQITDVIFRRYQTGDILAVFPYIMHVNPSNGQIEVRCYEHVGQHGSGVWSVIQRATSPVTDKDSAAVADLSAELRQIGYNLRVMRRINAARWESAKREARRALYV